MGYDLAPSELDDIFARFKNVAEKKKVRSVGMRRIVIGAA